MKATFGTTKKGTMGLHPEVGRIDGKSTTKTVRRLGLLEDIRAQVRLPGPAPVGQGPGGPQIEEEKAGQGAHFG